MLTTEVVIMVALFPLCALVAWPLQLTMMGGGAPLADHFTILGRVVLARQPPGQDGEPRCRVCIDFEVAFHKVLKPTKIAVSLNGRGGGRSADLSSFGRPYDRLPENGGCRL